MYAKSIAVATALAAFTSVVSAGTATVQNNCGYDVYVWSVADQADAPMTTLNSGNPSYSEAFRTNGNGGGISIKLSTQNDQSTVTQFEYTLSSDESNVYYDLSNINGNPFEQGGTSLTPSDSSCTSVSCAAGVSDCTGAYNQPDDNWATQGCSSSTDLTLTLCPGGSSKRDVPTATTVAGAHNAQYRRQAYERSQQ
ncbi:MAG: hypothetical protein M1819_005502 [Sarea resinae]|nr:MAG: hypothetical protein M1819_005502 [Sarea resinae]